MADVLGYDGLTDNEINESYRGLMSILIRLDPNVIFQIANSIWYRLGKPVRQEFIDITRAYFEAQVREMDWAMPGAADTINAWVEEHTNGKITDIIKPPISGDIAMFLINAIYFNAAWTIAFDPDDTKTGPFRLHDGSVVDCEMMRREDTIRYFINGLFQAAELPYGGGSFSMIILLPLRETTVDDIIAELTPENWAVWLDQFRDREIPFGMPKFKFDYGKRLDTILKQMGMAIAWEPAARGFSNMFADSTGWIDEVRHKAFVQVDESGTEAAAVTVVIMADSLYSTMYADRPFLFIIHERESGTILFMGCIARPNWES
jgi:serpin B